MTTTLPRPPASQATARANSNASLMPASADPSPALLRYRAFRDAQNADDRAALDRMVGLAADLYLRREAAARKAMAARDEREALR